MIIFLIAYLLGILGFLIYQRFAKKLSLRQTERELGPKSHKVKNGTITGGGIVFVLVTVLVTIFSCELSLKVIFILGPFLSFFLIGFLDDALIIKKKTNDGLSAKQKIIIEIITSLIFYFVYYQIDGTSKIYLFNYYIDLKYAYIFYFIFFFIASANTFNITDGLDGLLTGLTIEILLGLFTIAYFKNENLIMMIIIILIASISSFYFFNYPKAYIFMGDTGSLSLGAITTSIAIYLHVEIIFIIFLLPLIFETVSVILQVFFFKITKGKRLFKMAPFHHHLEFLGYSEKMITTLFMLVETILILIGLYFYGGIF